VWHRDHSRYARAEKLSSPALKQLLFDFNPLLVVLVEQSVFQGRVSASRPSPVTNGRFLFIPGILLGLPLPGSWRRGGEGSAGSGLSGGRPGGLLLLFGLFHATFWANGLRLAEVIELASTLNTNMFVSELLLFHETVPYSLFS